MIRWIFNKLVRGGRVGISSARELSKHRLHTTKYEDLCMQENGVLQALIGPIASLAGTWFENKVEKTKAEGQAKVAEARARATVAEKVAAGEVAWEGKMADATVDSWKDEFALVVLLAPAILVFIPGMKEYVKEGFDILATLPEWYQYLLYIAISASFGIKGVGQAAKMFKKK